MSNKINLHEETIKHREDVLAALLVSNLPRPWAHKSSIRTHDGIIVEISLGDRQTFEVFVSAT